VLGDNAILLHGKYRERNTAVLVHTVSCVFVKRLCRLYIALLCLLSYSMAVERGCNKLVFLGFTIKPKKTQKSNFFKIFVDR